MSLVIEPVVWEGVRGRRGPSRWIVWAALAVAVLLVVVGSQFVARGFASPDVRTDGWSSRWHAETSTADVTLRLVNAGQRPITVEAARMQAPDGSAYPWAEVVSLSPTALPSAPGADPSWDVPMTVRLHCDQAPAPGGDIPSAELVLTTSGTWPRHEAIYRGEFDMMGWCDPATG